jgi:hypothetical protein
MPYLLNPFRRDFQAKRPPSPETTSIPKVKTPDFRPLARRFLNFGETTS